jgi:hypothetical protein
MMRLPSNLIENSNGEGLIVGGVNCNFLKFEEHYNLAISLRG